MQHYKHGSVL